MAHPRWREKLLKEARQLRYVPSEQYLASQAEYLVHEERMVELKNGAKVLIRPARAADARGAAGIVPSPLARRRLHAVLPARSLAVVRGAAKSLQRES